MSVAKPLTILAFFVYLVGAQAQASGGLRAEGPYFKDEAGRPVLLTGINLSGDAKVPPFKPIPKLSQLKFLRDIGYNSIRLLFIWEAFEPVRGQYNYAYLKELTDVVEEASRFGIYTILDFHMDGFSRYTIRGCGSGSPVWAVPHPDTLLPDPANDEKCRYWNVFTVSGYTVLHNGFREAFDAFYADRNGVKSSYLAVLRVLARHFKNFPKMIGYDLLNEPWAEEATQLSPLYEDAAKAVRAEDPKSILFLEPANLVSDYALNSHLRKPSFSNVAYASHNYDPVVNVTGAWFDGELFIDRYFHKIRAIAQSWNAPIFIGEFGVGDGEGRGLRNLLRHYFHLYDDHFASAAQWVFSPNYTRERGDGWDHEDTSIVDGNGKLRKNFILRPRVVAVAGVPGKIYGDLGDSSKDRSLEFEWDHDPKLGATEIFVPPGLLSAPGKLSYHSENPDLACEFKADTYKLYCRSPTAGKKKLKVLE